MSPYEERKSSRKVTIAAVMRQEARFIIEWVAWHRLLGFDLMIADNGGSDGQSDLLSRLHALGHLTRLDFRAVTHKPQLPAYNALLRIAAAREVDYIGFLDADEFFEPITTELWRGAGRRLIVEQFGRTSASALAFNWQCFGDSHLSEPSDTPVTERFILAADTSAEINRHFKSFCNVSNIRALLHTSSGMRIHPHGPLIDSKLYRHDGGPLRLASEFGHSQHASWTHARIRHYIVKTYPEFIAGKAARGAPGRALARSPYNRAYFNENNYNEVASPLPPQTLDAVKLEIDRLRSDVATVDLGVAGLETGIAMAPWRLAWLARDFPAAGRWRRLQRSINLAGHTLGNGIMQRLQ